MTLGFLSTAHCFSGSAATDFASGCLRDSSICVRRFGRGKGNFFIGS